MNRILKTLAFATFGLLLSSSARAETVSAVAQLDLPADKWFTHFHPCVCVFAFARQSERPLSTLPFTRT